jgi:hypothetical protein
MNRVIAVAVCGLMLAGCGSILSISSLGSKGSEPVILKLESKPPGAEAKLSNGASCVTPCELPVAPGNDINVSFSLARHQPQSVTVHPVAAKKNFIGMESAPASFEPNPVRAELQPAAPPRKRPATTTKPSPAQPGAPATATAPPKTDQPAPPAATPVQAGQASKSAPAPSAAPSASPWPAPAPAPSPPR